MKTKFVVLLLISFSCLTPAMTKGECEDCKKLKDELTKSWQSSLNLSKEIRALTKDIVDYSERIRKFSAE